MQEWLGRSAGWEPVEVREAIAPHAELPVPEHFHVEVPSVLRRYALRRELSERRAATRWSSWSTRCGSCGRTCRPHDAAYLALARRLDVRLITLDGGLAAAARAAGLLHELP